MPVVGPGGWIIYQIAPHLGLDGSTWKELHFASQVQADLCFHLTDADVYHLGRHWMLSAFETLWLVLMESRD